MFLAWFLPFCASVLFCLVIGIVALHIFRGGLTPDIPGWRNREDEDIPVLTGVVVEDEPPFFDEHDLAMMEQHTEDPHFHGTVVEINGIRVGKDGMPETQSTSGSLWSWFRRGD